VVGTLCPIFDTPIRGATERHDNLKHYAGRMAARFYPDLREIAGWKPLPKALPLSVRVERKTRKPPKPKSK